MVKKTIDCKNINNKCFKYAVTAGLHHNEFPGHPEGINSHRPFEKLYHWKGIRFSSEQKNWGKLKKSCDIVLNVLFVDDEESDTIEIKQGYISKHNLERENQDILLMIMDK